MSDKLEISQPQNRVNADTVTVLSLGIAIVAVSLAAIFIRLSEQEIGANATVFNRLWLATLVLGLVNQFKKINGSSQPQTSLSVKQLLLLVLVGIVSSSSVICWAWSLTQTSVANSTVLRNLTPIFTSLGGWLLLGQKIDRRFAGGMTLAIVGAVAIAAADVQIGLENLYGDGVALLSAAFYATNLLLVENLRSQLPTGIILWWRCAIGAGLLLPLVKLTEAQLFPVSWQGWLAVIALAVVCQIVGQGLLISSLKHFSSGFIAVFLLLEPVLTAIFAWLVFAESLNLFNWIAFALVLGGIYLAKSSSAATKLVTTQPKS